MAKAQQQKSKKTNQSVYRMNTKSKSASKPNILVVIHAPAGQKSHDAIKAMFESAHSTLGATKDTVNFLFHERAYYRINEAFDAVILISTSSSIEQLLLCHQGIKCPKAVFYPMGNADDQTLSVMEKQGVTQLPFHGYEIEENDLVTALKAITSSEVSAVVDEVAELATAAA